MKKLACLQVLFLALVFFNAQSECCVGFSPQKTNVEPTRKTLIILVHGTFSKNEKWFHPSGGFYKQLQTSITEKHTAIIPFSWSGKPTCKARIEAAEALSRLIIKLSKSKKIITVGHSHGGNVINLASNLINAALQPTECVAEQEHSISEIAFQLSKLAHEEHCAAACMLQTDNKGHGDTVERVLAYGGTAKKIRYLLNTMHIKRFNHHFEKIDHWFLSLENTLDMIRQDDSDHASDRFEVIKQTLLDVVSRLQKQINIKSKYKTKTNNEHLIDKSFLLGCPVDEIAYLPNKQIIKHTFNITSLGDIFQKVLGIYKCRFSLNIDHISNINIQLKETPKSEYVKYPSHTDLHSPYVGRYILNLPQVLQQKDDVNEHNAEIYADFSEPLKITAYCQNINATAECTTL